MPRDFKQEKELLELKYKLKTELEHLIHKNIIEELGKGFAGKIKAREERRGK